MDMTEESDKVRLFFGRHFLADSSLTSGRDRVGFPPTIGLRCLVVTESVRGEAIEP
jgi:hypothetical protein